MSVLKTIGCVLLAAMFIQGGASTVANPDPRAAKVAHAGIPQAKQAAILNGTTMVIAGGALYL